MQIWNYISGTKTSLCACQIRANLEKIGFQCQIVTYNCFPLGPSETSYLHEKYKTVHVETLSSIPNHLSRHNKANTGHHMMSYKFQNDGIQEIFCALKCSFYFNLLIQTKIWNFDIVSSNMFFTEWLGFLQVGNFPVFTQ